MKIRITCTQVECGKNVWKKGDIATGRERDLQPLVDGGFAEELDAAGKPIKKAKE